MKYLHIIPPSTRMMRGFLLMLRKHFDLQEHEFLITAQMSLKDQGLVFCGKLHTLASAGRSKLKKLLLLRRLFRQAEHLVFHCFTPDLKWLLAIWLSRKKLPQAIWVAWGIDLYNRHRPGNSLKNRLYNYLVDDCAKRMQTVVVMCEPDIEVYNKQFDHAVFFAPYPFVNSHFEQMDAILAAQAAHVPAGDQAPAERAETDDGCLRIQVGHNAFPFNRHVEVVDMLTRFRTENIKVTFPVAYGDSSYILGTNYVAALESYCKMYLDTPDMVAFQTKMLPHDEYKRQLASMDIAILNAGRHNGLGNILQLLYLGKKVFLAADNPLRPYLQEKGFEVYHVEDIPLMSFEEFSRPVTKPVPRAWIRDTWGMEGVTHRWSEVFHHVETK